MNLVGKCPPDADSLAAAAARGFDAVELYLTAETLDASGVAAIVEAAPVGVASVHTPQSLSPPLANPEAWTTT
ncbi:MAG: hypothetical protein ABEJ78_01325, partial [Haloferacaceae archaeon]